MIITTIEHIPTKRKELCAVCAIEEQNWYEDQIKEAKATAKEFKLSSTGIGIWTGNDLVLKVEIGIFDSNMPRYDRVFWKQIKKDINNAAKNKPE